MAALDTIILGDNPFYGINHRSSSYALERAKRFENVDNILAVFKIAKKEGAGGVMLSSHANIEEIIQKMQKDPELATFKIYPHVPYLLKYVSEVTKNGVVGTAMNMLGAKSGAQNLKSMLSGGLGILKKDYYQMIESFLDIEIARYRGATLGTIFLHNGIVDLALGLGMKDFFVFYGDYIRNKYKVDAGFGTLNLVKLAKMLDEAGIKKPVIMAPFNLAGFFMNPSKKASEEALKQYDFTLLAMNALGSGGIGPEEAIKYLAGTGRIKNVVVGATSEAHIHETFSLAKKYL